MLSSFKLLFIFNMALSSGRTITEFIISVMNQLITEEWKSIRQSQITVKNVIQDRFQIQKKMQMSYHQGWSVDHMIIIIK